MGASSDRGELSHDRWSFFCTKYQTSFFFNHQNMALSLSLYIYIYVCILYIFTSNIVKTFVDFSKYLSNWDMFNWAIPHIPLSIEKRAPLDVHKFLSLSSQVASLTWRGIPTASLRAALRGTTP